MDIFLSLVFLAVVFFVGVKLWKKGKGKRKKQSQRVKEELWVNMVSQKNGDRVWPFPFESVEEIRAWWKERSDLWEGVDKIELATEAKARTLWQ